MFIIKYIPTKRTPDKGKWDEMLNAESHGFNCTFLITMNANNHRFKTNPLSEQYQKQK